MRGEEVGNTGGFSDPRVGMADYGTSLLATMNQSKYQVYVKLGQKMDLFLEEAGVAAMVARTHAFINNPGFGYFKMGARYKVRRDSFSPSPVLNPNENIAHWCTSNDRSF